MTTMAYDTSRLALLRPGERPTLFVAGQACDDMALAVEASRLAYLPFEGPGVAARTRLAADLALAGFDALVCFDVPRTGTQAYGAWRASDRTALLVFRGTQIASTRDLWTDADARLVRRVPFAGRVHAGFARAALSVRGQVGEWLQNAVGQRERLIVCGHSLGAALATLFAALPEVRPTLVVPVASPRVGDAAFVHSLATVRGCRIKTGCDLVTRVPFVWLGYRDAFDAVYIDRHGRRHSSLSQDMVRADTQGLRWAQWRHEVWRAGKVGVRDLTDHAPINYVRAYFPLA